MVKIGEDSSERLDAVPVQYRVIVTRRPKFACRSREGMVVQQPAPARLIEGGLPTEALVTQVTVARYADPQPLYRQAQMMARQGVVIDRSTLSFWMGYAAAEVAPVVTRLHDCPCLGTRLLEEIKVPVLDTGRGSTKQGYFWVVARRPPLGVALIHLRVEEQRLPRTTEKPVYSAALSGFRQKRGKLFRDHRDRPLRAIPDTWRDPRPPEPRAVRVGPTTEGG